MLIDLDTVRRRAALERMGDRVPRAPHALDGRPVDMRHARRFAEAVARNRAAGYQDPRWADHHRQGDAP